jgi:hypothetical protein
MAIRIEHCHPQPECGRISKMRSIGARGAQSMGLPEARYGVAMGLKFRIFTLDPKRL